MKMITEGLQLPRVEEVSKKGDGEWGGRQREREEGKVSRQ